MVLEWRLFFVLFSIFLLFSLITDLIQVSPEFKVADWDRATCSCFVPTCVLEPKVQVLTIFGIYNTRGACDPVPQSPDFESP